MGKHVPIEETPVFDAFEDCSRAIWVVVERWPSFQRDTLGKQLVRAIDSVGANLVEGDGRYGDLEALHHFVIARASAREAALWLKRAIERGLMNDPHEELTRRLADATRQLNALITYRRTHTANKTREELAEYAFDSNVG